MSLKLYIDNSMIAESLVESVDVEELDTLAEELLLIEGELNELFGFRKIASKLRTKADEYAGKLEKVSDEGDKKVATARKFVDDKAKAAGKFVDDKATSARKFVSDKAETAGKAIEKKKEDVKDSVVKSFGATQEAFKKFFNIKNLTAEQEATKKDLEPLYEKIMNGKTISGADTLKILAAVLAGAEEAGKVPGFKKYQNQLTRLRTTPGMSSFKFSVKANN